MLRFAVTLASTLTLLASMGAWAHEVSYALGNERAVVVSLSFSDQSPFAFRYYEVRQADDDALVQVGQTDASGRLLFLPRESGEYRVRAFTDDGHGVDFAVSVADAGQVAGYERPLFERFAKAIAGVGLVLGVFGAIALARCTRRPRAD